MVVDVDRILLELEATAGTRARSVNARRDVITVLRERWSFVSIYIPASPRKAAVQEAIDDLSPASLGYFFSVVENVQRLRLWMEGYEAARTDFANQGGV